MIREMQIKTTRHDFKPINLEKKKYVYTNIGKYMKKESFSHDLHGNAKKQKQFDKKFDNT